ncbi:hypothetical protein [Tsukamurella soli]
MLHTALSTASSPTEKAAAVARDLRRRFALEVLAALREQLA